MNNTQLHIQAQSFSLKRFPANQFDKSLRAWDAADEYIIDHVCENMSPETLQHIVIVNDSFGALTCAMARFAPEARIDVYTDSFMSEKGILQNLAGSNLDKNKVTVYSSLNLADAALKALNNEPKTELNLILLKVPRTLSYLEYLLIELNKLAQASTAIVAGAMVKLVTSSALKLFDTHLLDTKTSLARKKSRLIFATPKVDKTDTLAPQVIADDELEFDLHNFANVFCRDQVDIGARYLLKHMPKIIKDNQVIIDLGCGNGILGTHILHQHPSAKLVFVDESYMAIASAKSTLIYSGANSNNATFSISHCLQDYPNQQANLVICNPPFHQQNTVVDDIAWQMFVDAKRVLIKGGELRIVGNRHLDHRAKLSKLFGGCEVIASDSKFVVLSAIK